MPVKRLKEHLDTNGIKYVIIRHSPAYTAQEVAASAHIPGKELAKTVMVTIDDDMAMAVLPASYHVNMDRLAEITGAKHVGLAKEEEFNAVLSVRRDECTFNISLEEFCKNFSGVAWVA